MLNLSNEISCDKIKSPLLSQKDISMYLLRLDKTDNKISGNKWFKLSLNLAKAKKENYTTLLTFGGAYSNHLHATAAAANQFAFKSIGIIRGEAYPQLNATLQFAQDMGMQLHYLNRQDYKKRSEPEFLKKLISQFETSTEKVYSLPEGGTNQLAVEGCANIPQLIKEQYDIICCPIGSGGTLAGIISGTPRSKKIIGFSALKGANKLDHTINNLLPDQFKKNTNWDINHKFHFGGFAKIKPELIYFIQDFYQQHQIKLDVVYTGKMMYGLFELINNNHFSRGTSIVAVHTGGLQGNALLESQGKLYFSD